jgi:hypothetical protein
MNARLFCLLALLLNACGGTTVDPSGAGGHCTTGNAGAGGAAPLPVGAVCEELITGSLDCPTYSYDNPLISWVRASPVIFRGTVTALHAVTPGLPIDDTSRTVIAHVDKVIHVNGGSELEGQDVTVDLVSAPTMAVGYVGYFFTYGQLYGQTLAVGEVAHVDPGVFANLEADVPGIVGMLAEAQIYRRMMSSQSVVVGTVTAIETLPLHGGMSEHDPLWAIATLSVDCALRGPLRTSTTFVFPTNDDIAWSDRPKITLGQQGVFFLQPAFLPPGSVEIPEDVPLFVSDKSEVRALDERGHVATLIHCPVVL